MNRLLRQDIRKNWLLFIICIIVLAFYGYSQQSKLSSKSIYNAWIVAICQQKRLPRIVSKKLLVELDKKGIEAEQRYDIVVNWIEKYIALKIKLSRQTDVMAKQAKIYLNAGKLENLENLYSQSLAKNLKSDNLAAARDTFALAQIKILQLNYLAAKQYFQQAVKLDPVNPVYKNNLASHLYTLGKYELIESTSYRNVAIWGKTLGKNHPNIGIELQNAARLCAINNCQYVSYQQLHQRSLILLEREVEKSYLGFIAASNTAIAKTVLGENYFNLPYFSTDRLSIQNSQTNAKIAKTVYQNALADWRNVITGPLAGKAQLNEKERFYLAHPEDAFEDKIDTRYLTRIDDAQQDSALANTSSIFSLAKFYAKYHDYAEEEALYSEISANIAKYINPYLLDNPENTNAESVAIQTSLANSYFNRGNFAKAEPIYEKKLSGWGDQASVLSNTWVDDGFYEDDFHLSIDLINLALVYDVQGKTLQAATLHQRAFKILGLVLGGGHTNIEAITSTLIEYHSITGNPRHAAVLNQRSFAIIEKTTSNTTQRHTQVH